MKFKFLSGDVNWKEYGGKFISRKLNNGEFDYWLVLDVINMHDATGNENQDKYSVQINCVSPQQAGNDALERAFESWGESVSDNVIQQVEVLADYGVSAALWHKSGNNIRELMKAARKESDLISFLFGFYMDRPQNRIGQTGWDLITGQSVRAFFSANKESK